MTALGVRPTRPWVYTPYALGRTLLARSAKRQAPSTWRHVLGVLGVLSVLARPPENCNPCGRPVNRQRPGTDGAGRRQARHMAASLHKRSCQDAQDTQDPQECAREAPCTNHHVPRANSSTNHHAPRTTHQRTTKYSLFTITYSLNRGPLSPGNLSRIARPLHLSYGRFFPFCNFSRGGFPSAYSVQALCLLAAKNL